MKTLTTTRPLGTANRWRVEKAIPFDEHDRLVCTVQLINNGNLLVSEREINIGNGTSDRVDINLAPLRLADSLLVDPNAVTSPTGYVDALAAWRSSSTQAGRREALETWMLAAGVAGLTLAGT